MTDNTVAVIWPMYIALFTSIASIITAVITGFINHKTIKSNNNIIIRKAELDFSKEKFKLFNNSYNKYLLRFIDATCNYIQMEFFAMDITVNPMIDFTSAYYALYVYCDKQSKLALSGFFNHILTIKRSSDDVQNKQIADDLLIKLNHTVENLVILESTENQN